MTTETLTRRPTTTIDAAEVRPRTAPALPWALAVGADLAGAVLLGTYPGALVPAAAAALLHLLGGLPLAREPALSPSERTLAWTLSLTLPVVGAPLAAVALRTVGRSEITEAPPADTATELVAPDPDEVRRMAEALP